MDITQSKKTGLYSLTKLTKEDLVSLHNTLRDYTLKTKIRLALLNLMPGDERAKLSDEDAIESYLESQGLVLKAGQAPKVSQVSSDDSDGDEIPDAVPANLNGGVQTEEEEELEDLPL